MRIRLPLAAAGDAENRVVGPRVFAVCPPSRLESEHVIHAAAVRSCGFLSSFTGDPDSSHHSPRDMIDTLTRTHPLPIAFLREPKWASHQQQEQVLLL
jgi:hypothetical protein